MTDPLQIADQFDPGDYRLVDAPPYGVCEECGALPDQPGFVNYGHPGNPDCPGCDRCDLPCLTCNPGGHSR